MKRSPTRNDLLRRAREEHGWTQQYLADQVDVQAQTIHSWERGTRFPSLEHRNRLCDIFAQTPEQLGLQPTEKVAQTLPLDESSSPALPIDQEKDTQPHRGDANRQRMIDRVRSRWISGILDNSLHQAARIELKLQEQPDAVINPWQLEIQESNLPSRSLPPGTRIAQVYDDAGGELLILGEPGAGKTTLLLELARDLLDRAENDEKHPLPVVFHLSSWAMKCPSITDWLVEELKTKYQVPYRVGHKWVTIQAILPLLDGLDEVALAHRQDCIRAINTYRQEQGLVPLIVCSRSAEYFDHTSRLLLRTAVIIQSLTAQQVESYLISAGKEMEAVRRAFQDDHELQELVATPLMLSVLTLAYHGTSVEDLVAEASPEARRLQVLTAYVQRMLGRRGTRARYTTQQTIHWLTWLAQQMAHRSQTEFFVERIQPDWLPDTTTRERYRRRIVQFIFGVEVIIISALFSWLRGGEVGSITGVGRGLLGQLGSGPGNTVLGWMAPGLGGGLEGGGSLGIIIDIVSVLTVLLISMPLIPRISMKAGWRGLSSGGRSGLIIVGILSVFSGLLFSLSGGLGKGVVRGLGVGLFSGLISGLLSGLLAGLRYEQDTQRSRTANQDQKSVRPILSRKPRWLLERLTDVLIFSLCAGLSFGSVNALLIRGIDQNVFIYGSIVGFFNGIVFGLGDGTNLIRGLGTEIRPAEIIEWSWNTIGQNLAENVKKGLVVALAITGSVALIIGIASGLFYGGSYGLRYGLVYGLIVGLIGGVAAILTGVISSGWASSVLAEHQRFRPNEGIVRSARNGVFAAVIFGPIGGLASGLVSGLAFGLVGGLASWPILGTGLAIVFGTVFALQFLLMQGGIASLEHYVLRGWLYRTGAMPLNYVPFLDYAAERILLRKVGGGYIFAHRLLLDYFVTTGTPPDSDKNATEVQEV